MNAPQKMRVLEIAELGGPQSARIVEKPIPVPSAGEVLIRVGAAGVNYADVMQTRGTYMGGPKPPYTAGFEFSGKVIALGEGAPGHILYSRVIGSAGGAFAEYVTARVNGLMSLPKGWTEPQGAAWFVNWFTAMGCLRTFGRLDSGESVLIHAGAGGVGQAAIRLAKLKGARVFATASTPEKLNVARRLGADVVINYREEDFVRVVREQTGGLGVDLILEMVGGKTFHKNLKAVKTCGRIVVFGAASAEQASVDNISLIFHPVELIGFHLGVLAVNRPDLLEKIAAELNDLVRREAIRPDEPKVLDLEEGPRALADLETRQTIGKAVLVP